MKTNRYMDRAMRSSDKRFAKALGRLGYVPRVAPDPLAELKAEAVAAGVTVDGRWSEARIRQEIAEARKAATVVHELKPKPEEKPPQAQQKSEPKPKVKPTAKPKVESGKPKRTYARRDMRAED